MFILTQDHTKVLAILEKSGWLRAGQISRIVGDTSGGVYTSRLIRQLGYMQKFYPKDDDIIALRSRSHLPVDTEMLSAVDIMLDISGGNLLAASSSKPPFKLCFLMDSAEGVGSYGVVVVPPGFEEVVNLMLAEVDALRHTCILLLEDMGQRENIRLEGQHLFAVFDGKYRFFKGP